jgi:hypothetical protein
VALAVALGAPAAAWAATAPAATAPAATAAPAAAPVSAITAVSCAGKTCIGLSALPTVGINGTSQFLRIWTGKAWGPAFAPIPASAHGGAYDEISCLSAKYCVAAGGVDTPNALVMVAATWNGSSWSAHTMPAPGGRFGNPAIYRISCPTTRMCVAVGDYFDAGRGGALRDGFADIWNGTTWKASWTMSAGSNGAGAGDLSDVSCRTAASCVAVGETFNGLINVGFLQAKTIKPVALVWNGRGWTKVAPPVPAGGHGTLSGVNCWAVKHCAVAGAYYPSNGLGSETAYGDFWNGAKWTAVKMPAGGRNPTPGAVSCVSGSSCLMVGASVVSGSGDLSVKRSFADAWNGHGWKAVAVGVPKGGTGTTNGFPNGYELYAVGCATAADCVALGFAGPPIARGTPTNFAEAYNGKRLSVVADS